MTRVVRVVFLAHGVITLAAAIVLVVAPAAIPATVGIALEPGDVLLPYLLAAAELGIALLSLGAVRLRDPAAVRLIALVFAVFHAATAALEVVYAVSVASGPILVANIVVRVIATVVFGAIAVRSGR